MKKTNLLNRNVVVIEEKVFVRFVFVLWIRGTARPCERYLRLVNDRRWFRESAACYSKAGRSREKKAIPLLLTTQVYRNKIK